MYVCMYVCMYPTVMCMYVCHGTSLVPFSSERHPWKTFLDLEESGVSSDDGGWDRSHFITRSHFASLHHHHPPLHRGHLQIVRGNL